MILADIEVRTSEIEGRGVFLKQNVEKGELLIIYTYGISELIHKDQHDDACSDFDNSPHPDIVDSSIRYVHNWFIYDAYTKHNTSFGCREGDFVNHSFDPSMIYHCGLCFAARDLVPGDELTVDYRHFLSEDIEGFTDMKSGRHIKGVSGKKAFISSLKKLNELFVNDPLYVEED
jgi:hypothetical protein